MADGDDEAANAPLIHHDDENDVPSHRETIHLQEGDPTSPSAFVWALTFTAGISGLLFGYEYNHHLPFISNGTHHSLAPVSSLRPSSPSKAILVDR
jgi:hypothetical protein